MASEASYVYILVDKSSLKMPNTYDQFLQVLKDLKLAVKQCYQVGPFILDKNWRKMPKLKNSNNTFSVIFKQCTHILLSYVMLDDVIAM